MTEGLKTFKNQWGATIRIKRNKMTITDAIQIALSYNGLFGALSCTLICYLAFWAYKITGLMSTVFFVSVKFLFGNSRKQFLSRFGGMLARGYVLFLFRGEISDALQWFETPVYQDQYSSLSDVMDPF